MSSSFSEAILSGRSLFTSQSDYHYFTAEVRMPRKILNRADRNDSVGRIDRHAASVLMMQRHNVIDIWVFRQQALLLFV